MYLIECHNVLADGVVHRGNHTSNEEDRDAALSGDTIVLSAELREPGNLIEVSVTTDSSPPITSNECSGGSDSMFGSPQVQPTKTAPTHIGMASITKYIDVLPVIPEGVVTRGKSTRKTTICSKTPPDFQSAKDIDTFVPSKKSVWIMHPGYGEVVVAAGKTGPGPRSKLLKDYPPCPEGAQWIHVLCVFKPQVPVMHPDPNDDRITLECAMPPKRGKHKLLLWNSKFLIPYKVDTIGGGSI